MSDNDTVFEPNVNLNWSAFAVVGFIASCVFILGVAYCT